MNEVLTLFELNSLVHEVIEDNFDEQYWVVGELSDVSTPAYGGHFYGELVQKDEESDRIVARARITCWARNYNMASEAVGRGQLPRTIWLLAQCRRY